MANQTYSIKGRVLIVAGSDSGGGAGIQADVKTITMLGSYAATAITAITAQNTLGVSGVHVVPNEMIRDQIVSVITDIGADVIKTGMLVDKKVMICVADALKEHARDVPRVVDPVMVAKGGAPLMQEDAVEVLKERLITRDTLLTPNIPEAEVLIGRKIQSVDDMKAAATALSALGARAVLIKGGHLEGDRLIDILLDEGDFTLWETQRIQTRHTHGTGCTLASGIAAYLAQGHTIREAVDSARAFVLKAIDSAPGFGEGQGPLNHCHPLRRDET